jgi:hypothetical protein
VTQHIGVLRTRDPREIPVAGEYQEAMSNPLHLDIFVVPYKAIVGLIPPRVRAKRPGRQRPSR